MKASVSLPADDVAFLDSYAQAQGLHFRSAALHQAAGLLRTAQLAAADEDAWNSWTSTSRPTPAPGFAGVSSRIR
jgi:hypothetical protein